MVKNDQVKKIEKGDVVTRFLYTLKNIDPSYNLQNSSGDINQSWSR